MSAGSAYRKGSTQTENPAIASSHPCGSSRCRQCPVSNTRTSACAPRTLGRLDATTDPLAVQSNPASPPASPVQNRAQSGPRICEFGRFRPRRVDLRACGAQVDVGHSQLISCTASDAAPRRVRHHVGPARLQCAPAPPPPRLVPRARPARPPPLRPARPRCPGRARSAPAGAPANRGRHPSMCVPSWTAPAGSSRPLPPSGTRRWPTWTVSGRLGPGTVPVAAAYTALGRCRRGGQGQGQGPG